MAQISKGYKLNTNKELQELYNKVCNKCIEMGMFDYIPKLYLFKSTRTWGWARYNQTVQRKLDLHGWRYEYHYTEKSKPIVALNEVFIQNPQKALQTICHELAHIAVDAYCKRNYYKHESHSDTWYSKYRKIGECFGMKYNEFTRTDSEEDVGLQIRKNKYEVYCNHCHRVITREKRCRIIEHPERWKCDKCGAILSKTKGF